MERIVEPELGAELVQWIVNDGRLENEQGFLNYHITQQLDVNLDQSGVLPQKGLHDGFGGDDLIKISTSTF